MAVQQATLTQRPKALAGNTDTSLLKMIALVSMIIDHIGVAYWPALEMRVIGRIAMPLFVWCLVVGTEYTRNAFRYALRLFILGVISQPLYIMVLGATWTHLNILFLLCLGVLAIAGIQKKWYFSQYWAPLLCLLVTLVIDIDYGWEGLAFILAMYSVRYSKGGIVATFLAAAVIWGYSSYAVPGLFGFTFTFLNQNIFAPLLKLFFQVQSMMWMALPFILIPMHSGLKLPKWLGYGVYPLHLLALLIAGLFLGTSLQAFIDTLKVL
jgi:hypothetical protein